MLAGTAALRPSVAGLRPFGGELKRDVEIGGLDDPNAGEKLLRLQEWSVAEHRLPTTVVDDGGCARRSESAGEEPVAIGLQAIVERIDGRHFVCGGGASLELGVGSAGLVVNHGKHVLHLGSSPLVRGHQRGRPLTHTTNASAPFGHRLPNFSGELSEQVVVWVA